jgi:hypothetical protein
MMLRIDLENNHENTKFGKHEILRFEQAFGIWCFEYFADILSQKQTQHTIQKTLYELIFFRVLAFSCFRVEISFNGIIQPIMSHIQAKATALPVQDFLSNIPAGSDH